MDFGACFDVDFGFLVVAGFFVEVGFVEVGFVEVGFVEVGFFEVGFFVVVDADAGDSVGHPQVIRSRVEPSGQLRSMQRLDAIEDVDVGVDVDDGFETDVDARTDDHAEGSLGQPQVMGFRGFPFGQRDSMQNTISPFPDWTIRASIIY